MKVYLYLDLPAGPEPGETANSERSDVGAWQPRAWPFFLVVSAGHLPHCEEILSSTGSYSLVTTTNTSLEAQQPSDPVE